jgi:hypothetical protein
MKNRFLTLLFGMLASSLTIAGHHEEPQVLAPMAQADQVIVLYEVPCSDVAIGIVTLKELIAHEVSASPIAYSSSPGLIGDNAIGAVDLHLSMASMEKAIAWQEGNEKWKTLQAKSLKACGVNVDDIKVTVVMAQ